MNLIKITIVGMMLFSTIAYGSVKGSLPEFANMKIAHGALIITTDDSQAQYIGSIGNNGISARLPPSSAIEVPLNENSVFYIRHFSITFTPLPEGKGFVVKKTADLRSVRRGLKEESFSINIDPNGSLIFGEVSVKEESSGGAGKNLIERQANSVEKSTNKVQPKPPAMENPRETEIAEQAVPQVKTTAELVTRKVDGQMNARLLGIIGFAGLVALILVLWGIKKGRKS